MQKTEYNTVSKSWNKEKKKEWDKNAEFWVKIIRENLDPFRIAVTNKAILRPVDNNKNLKILDAGCGEGYLSRSLAKLGHETFGIDFCPRLINAAKELERKKPLGIKYFVRDFRKTGFPSSFFDAVLSHQTIIETKNPGIAINESARILKKGGRFICLFLHPCFDFKPENLKKSPLSLLYFQKTQIKKDFYFVSGIKSPSPYFYLHLPLSEWVSLLLKAGFSINDIQEPHPSLDLLKKNKWWRDNFVRPRFILIESEKR